MSPRARLSRCFLAFVAAMTCALLALATTKARADADGPSHVIYPEQRIPLHFSHSVHLTQGRATCRSCHEGAWTSTSARDRLLPAPAVCDRCHGPSHTQGAAKEGCPRCHVADGKNAAPRLLIPRANLFFPHAKHVTRNIGCAQCHGDLSRAERATRASLPRMQQCLTCHDQPDAAARGEAKSACDTCHLPAVAGVAGGRLRTSFPEGELKPPAWLRGAAHTPDFTETHKRKAGEDSSFCATCHTEDSCASCHDGRVRPRGLHPNDYLSMHAIEARLAMHRCTSCHQETSFCLPCHQRLGIAQTSGAGARMAGRFHPSRAVYTDPPRGPGHHAAEAQRNLAACVSCHVERDCIACHGARGIGAGIRTHRPGFDCARAMGRNARPCFACHVPDDPVLARCR